MGAVDSLATPSGDERACKASGETADDGTTSGDVSLAAAAAVAVSGDENWPVLALCTGLRTFSALRNTVISYARVNPPAAIATSMPIERTCLLCFRLYFMLYYFVLGWLVSRVVRVLDSRAEGPGFEPQPQCCRVTVLGKQFVSLFTKQRN